jgi:hypothetical protein
MNINHFEAAQLALDFLELVMVENEGDMAIDC